MLNYLLIFRSLENFLREHKVIDAAVYDNHSFILRFEIIWKYKFKKKFKIMIDSWHMNLHNYFLISKKSKKISNKSDMDILDVIVFFA